ncbi:MAG: pantoate kinase [Methanoregula sp.]|jgi:pantoate kinase|uniref:pantoate kinase n=1 Tax=Methanoregula sp. TaxID=2052170 RepID=UPI0025EB4704|nr:pantoate kinase [Methanoregula sp.]MCK9630338.1 pantoate kinase [Methanoregula sp.]
MVTAFCPGHISGYFKRVNGTTRADTGSIGAGIIIDKGVTATVVKAGSTSIHVDRVDANGKRTEYASESPLLSSVMDRLGVTASVVTECRLPIGAGFGLSAAALLATLTALNRLYGLNQAGHDIALLAHEAEVMYHTGLGDVAACQGGGWVVRKGPGIDATIQRRYDLTEPLYAVSFGPIHTPSVLGSQQQMERVASAFPRRSPDNVDDLFRISQEFAVASGLVTREVREVIQHCGSHGIPASMTMLGNGVFAYGRDARDLLGQFGEVYECAMARSGVRITGERP